MTNKEILEYAYCGVYECLQNEIKDLHLFIEKGWSLEAIHNSCKKIVKYRQDMEDIRILLDSLE